MLKGTRNDLEAEGYKFMFYIGKKHNTALYKKDEFRFIMRQNKEGWFQYLHQYIEGKNAGLYLTERMKKQDEGKIMGFDRLPKDYLKMSDKEQEFAIHEAKDKIAQDTIDYLIKDDDAVVEHWEEPKNVIENKIRMHNYEIQKPKNMTEALKQINNSDKVEIYDNGSVYIGKK